MGLFSGLFGKSQPVEFVNPVKVDMHSHLLPGIDDGVDNFDEAVAMIQAFAAKGYKKLVTTPHMMADFYRNKPEEIRLLCAELNTILKEKAIDVVVEAAAEYYLDELFAEELCKKSLLTFGSNYVLVESSFMQAADNFSDLIFKAKIAGYQPVLAHPERYVYMYDDFEKYRRLYDTELLFQININSLTGYYSKEAKKIAEQLIKEEMVDFVGSDAHHFRNMGALEAGINTKAFQKLVAGNKLKNNELLG